MLGIHHFWLFLLSGILLNLTPGQDTMYILGRSLSGGRAAGVASALGISVGSLLHTLAAALGLSALLATSATAFTIVKLAGAIYLAYLGLRMLFARASTPAVDPARAQPADQWPAFRQGILTNLLNPKVALFFLAFLPQFIDPASPHKVTAFLALGGTFICTGTLWCLALAMGAARFRRFLLANPTLRLWTDRCVGGLFVLLGARLALQR
jgi:threonine/homoserine/homoserine lactone efflux protein